MDTNPTIELEPEILKTNLIKRSRSGANSEAQAPSL